MYRTVALFFAVVALAVCASKTYHITLLSPATVGGAELKAGDYKFIVDDNTLTVAGKPESKTTIKVETVKDKYAQTAVRLNSADGKSRIQEIRLGGTNTKLVVSEPAANAGN